MKIRFVLYLMFVAFSIQELSAQELSELGEKEPFTIHGGIGGGLNFYDSNEDNLTRDPFSWNIHGNLTPSFYGVSIPLSFSITQFSKSYSTPFSRFGISPTYKWAKLHLGYRSISISPLIFDGLSFLGAGTELNPGDFYFAAFYGRLNKAITEDTLRNRNPEPQYSRRAYGMKFGLKKESSEIYLQYFRAQDDTSSIRRYNDSPFAVTPQFNNVVGSSWSTRFFNLLSFSGDIAVSIWNRDMAFAELNSIGGEKLPFMARALNVPVNYSSTLSWSGQAQLGMNLNRLNLMVGYKRVEPDFKSLGIPYMLNDVEMINGNIGTNFFEGKLSLNAGFATQHNNLRGMLSSRLASNTANLSANAFFSEHFNLNTTLTTAKVFQKDGLERLTDTTRMNQLMLTVVVAPSLNFTGDGLQHTISGNLSYTNLNDRNPLTTEFSSGKNINTSANYSVYIFDKYININSGLQYSIYQQKHSDYKSIGVNIGAGTQLLESRALSIQGDVGYFINTSSNSPAGNNLTFSANINYNAGKHHSFGAYASYILTPPVNLNPLDEIYNVPYAVNSKIFSGGLSYSYNF